MPSPRAEFKALNKNAARFRAAFLNKQQTNSKYTTLDVVTALMFKITQKKCRSVKSGTFNKQQTIFYTDFLDATGALAFRISRFFQKKIPAKSSRGPSDDRKLLIYNSVYFRLLPFAFSTGYFSAFRAIFASMIEEMSIPEILANSIA